VVVLRRCALSLWMILLVLLSVMSRVQVRYSLLRKMEKGRESGGLTDYSARGRYPVPVRIRARGEKIEITRWKNEGRRIWKTGLREGVCCWDPGAGMAIPRDTSLVEREPQHDYFLAQIPHDSESYERFLHVFDCYDVCVLSLACAWSWISLHEALLLNRCMPILSPTESSNTASHCQALIPSGLFV